MSKPIKKLLEFLKNFLWDNGNADKNFIKHNVTNQETEQVFFDLKCKISSSPIKVQGETRKILVGKTISGRLLFVVFTIRNQKVRVISARDLNKKKEGDLYEKTT